MVFLEVHNLSANINGKEILNGLCFGIDRGQVHAIMGPNGSGKSTLANIIMGHPKYSVTSGSILVEGENILELTTEERAEKGPILRFSISDRNSRSRIQSFFEERIQYTE